MKQRFWGLGGGVGSLLILFFLVEGFKSVMGDFFSAAHPIAYNLISWTKTFEYKEITSPLKSYFSTITILFLVACTLLGFIQLIRYFIIEPLYKKKIETEEFPCQEELAKAIRAIYSSEDINIIDFNILSFMKAFVHLQNVDN